MKKLLLVVVLVVMGAALFAEFTPYGSASVGFWYESQDKDMYGPDGRTFLNYTLQNNSHFGVDFKRDGYTAKVQFNPYGNNGNVGLDYLYVAREMGFGTLTVGQTEDGTNILASQVWGDELGLAGYGAVYGGYIPQVRFDLSNGLYFALMQTKVVHALESDLVYSIAHDYETVTKALIPKINFGYNMQFGQVKVMPTVTFQTFQYDMGNFDQTITSYLIAASAEYKDNAFYTKAQINYGVNTGNMGYEGPTNKAIATVSNNGSADATTFGGFAMVGFDVMPNLNVSAGAGYTMTTTSSDFNYATGKKLSDNADDRMAFYLQGAFKLDNGLTIVPELGMVDEMKNLLDGDEGSLFYVGTQLKFDF